MSVLFFGMLPWLLFLGGILYLGLRLVSAFERRSLPQRDVTLEARLRALEETVGELSASLERVTEAQEFTTRLLSKRSSASEGDQGSS